MATIERAIAEAAPARLDVEEGIAIIRLNDAGRPVNVLSRPMVEALTAIIAQLEAGGHGARAAIILSEKPGVWIAGADIDEFREFTTAADAERASRTGHELLGRLERLAMPTVAVIDGVALGGGLEVALACAYRVASDSPKTKLGLPEVQLGILPGAGGTQRLPRLIGLRSALDLMLTGKQLDARRARKVGLVDDVVPAAGVLQAALQVARELADGTRRPRLARPRGSPDAIERVPGMKAVILRKAREGVMKKTHGLYPAPLRILEVVEQGLGRPLEQGLELEARAFGELAVTPQARSLVHVFFTSTEAKRSPVHDDGEADRADPAERIVVVGAGFMGAGIATVAAEREMQVRLKDVTPEAAAKGLATAQRSLVERAKKRRRPRHEVTALTDRVTASTEYTGLRTAELVVEAVFEDLELKHRVIRDIEAHAGEQTVVGSNTSTIPIARLAEASQRPEHLIGLHFFSPVEKMPLLEIIVTERTAPRAIAVGHGFAKRLGKTPIVVNDGPGFYVNRILGPYMNEAALLIEEGVAIEAIDAAMVGWGFPVGPITLYDEVGLDVAQKSGRVLAEAFADRIAPTSVIEAMVADQRLGRKNGRGFYRYQGGKKAGVDPAVYALVGARPRHAMPQAEIQERLALGMINEAVRCLQDGILNSARDGDVGAVFGIGFPPFRGGPFWYVDQQGAAKVAERLRALEAAHGPRFAPAPLLVRHAEAGEPFTPGRG